MNPARLVSIVTGLIVAVILLTADLALALKIIGVCMVIMTNTMQGVAVYVDRDRDRIRK